MVLISSVKLYLYFRQLYIELVNFRSRSDLQLTQLLNVTLASLDGMIGASPHRRSLCPNNELNELTAFP